VKLAVRTLGMPGVPVRESVRIAVEHGCRGLELRVHPDEQVHIGLTSGKISQVRSLIEDADLEVASLAGYAKVCEPGQDEPVITELRALIDLAHRLGAPAVRVFPGGEADSRPRIGAVLDDLRASGVRLLVETHDSHSAGARAMRLVKPFAEPELVAVLWDALHPWRHGEQPARTHAVLGRYLGFFQIKDVAGVHDLTPIVPGTGALPLAECGELLRGWPGWVSLEWEKAWYPVGPVEAPLRAAAAWVRRYG
jgi:sugar phosphate isomerase/epimerase